LYCRENVLDAPSYSPFFAPPPTFNKLGMIISYFYGRRFMLFSLATSFSNMFYSLSLFLKQRDIHHEWLFVAHFGSDLAKHAHISQFINNKALKFTNPAIHKFREFERLYREYFHN
jgi:hypothetical protein